MKRDGRTVEKETHSGDETGDRESGAVVGVNPALPEKLNEQFLEMMFDCPGCKALGLRRPEEERERGH